MKKKLSEKEEPLLGAHMSTAGGLHTAFERANRVGCNVIQIFTKNSNQWKDPELLPDTLDQYWEARQRSNVKIVLSHSSYLINLCSVNTSILLRSRTAFVNEIKRCDKLGINFLIFHPGAHTTMDRKRALALVSESLNMAHEATGDTRVVTLIETTAGQGTTVGRNFEEIAEIVQKVANSRRIGVCLDTCHVFAAGYDIRTEDSYQSVMKEFDKVIGLKNLMAIHINDSKKGLGSAVDRHDHIGKGEIGIQAFSLIINDRRFTKIPMVLETPKGNDGYEMDIINLSLLRSLIKR
ncbi:MAG: deoxyribonuclease IV [Candidatus Kryptoniota bacterium]